MKERIAIIFDCDVVLFIRQFVLIRDLLRVVIRNLIITENILLSFFFEISNKEFFVKTTQYIYFYTTYLTMTYSVV